MYFLNSCEFLIVIYACVDLYGLTNKGGKEIESDTYSKSGLLLLSSKVNKIWKMHIECTA